jgi:hypothetical protein
MENLRWQCRGMRPRLLMANPFIASLRWCWLNRDLPDLRSESPFLAGNQPFKSYGTSNCSGSTTAVQFERQAPHWMIRVGKNQRHGGGSIDARCAPRRRQGPRESSPCPAARSSLKIPRRTPARPYAPPLASALARRGGGKRAWQGSGRDRPPSTVHRVHRMPAAL